jgi:hypothetical protein
MEKRVLAFLVAVGLLLAFAGQASAQEPLSIQNVSASAQALPNGNNQITFVAVVSLNVVPIAFNYHWERSDGAKTALKVVKVSNAGEQTYRLVERWTVGPNVQVADLWEKVFVNSGNTHIASEEIRPGSVEQSAAPAPAPVAGAHPAYLHALSDLRLARALLRGWVNPLIGMQMQQAVEEIERAVNDIVEAAISDGKNIEDHPPIDAALDNRGRLVRAHELLNKAYNDIDQRETNPADLALRSKALGHISKARQDLNEARTILKWL